MRKKKSSKAIQDPTPTDLASAVAELAAVKRLLMLLLAKLGSTSAEIGDALSLEQSTVRRMMQFRRIEKIPLPKAD